VEGNRWQDSGRRSTVVIRRAWVWAAGAIISLSTAFFLLASGAGLSDPGLQYDELLFVNAALGDPHPYHDFIYSEALGIPTMLMPYIGALKAWLYTPIFAVFGVSVDSIRVPAVLLAALALVLTILLVYRLLGMWPAVALAVLLGTDPVYSSVSRADWGPVVLSALLRVTALLCYFAFLRLRKVRYLWLLVLALSLGLFNKLDYVWFIAALGVAALVVHHRELAELLRRKRAAMLAPIAVLIAVGIAAFVTLILPAEELPRAGPHLSLGGRISEVEQLFRSTFDGAAVYQYMTGSPLGHITLMATLFPWILIGCVAVAVWSLVWGRRRKPDDSLGVATTTTTFFVVMFIVLAAGITATRQATGPHNIMLLWPLPAVLAVCLLATVICVSLKAPRLAALAVVVVALTALTISQVRATVTYVDAYRSDRQWSTPWSPEIYAAAHAVAHSATGVDSIITADWGLGTQIYALGNEAVRDRFADEWPSFTSPTATSAALKREWFDGRSVIVIFHIQSAQIMPSTTQRVETILKSLGSRARPLYVGRQIEAEIVAG
jgi:4-amino-4-deoxy-L-arabinose transferase-like glycosyltransferase